MIMRSLNTVYNLFCIQWTKSGKLLQNVLQRILLTRLEVTHSVQNAWLQWLACRHRRRVVNFIDRSLCLLSRQSPMSVCLCSLLSIATVLASAWGQRTCWWVLPPNQLRAKKAAVFYKDIVTHAAGEKLISKITLAALVIFKRWDGRPGEAKYNWSSSFSLATKSRKLSMSNIPPLKVFLPWADPGPLVTN